MWLVEGEGIDVWYETITFFGASVASEGAGVKRCLTPHQTSTQSSHN